MEENMIRGIELACNNRRAMWLFLLLTLLILMVSGQDKETSGVQVLEFQKDGVPSWWTMAEYKGQVDRKTKIYSATMCARFKLFFIHSRGTLFQLFDRPQKLDAQLKMELWLDRVRAVFAHRWKFQPLEIRLRTYR